MAMKYHPDKVANAGEQIKQQATEKLRTINEAYEHIKSSAISAEKNAKFDV